MKNLLKIFLLLIINFSCLAQEESAEDVLSLEEQEFEEVSPSKEDQEITEEEKVKIEENIDAINVSVESSLEFNPKAIWGPIKARLIPDTKHTFARIVSNNISNMSAKDYRYAHDLTEYLMENEEARERVFELTGFNERDLKVARKYFDKYGKGRFTASKATNFALKTSSHGKVSKQIGGLYQFLFELSEVNNQVIGDSLKFAMIKGTTVYLRNIWSELYADCNDEEPNMCTEKTKKFLDLNDDTIIDQIDIDIAMKSLDYTEKKIYGKIISKVSSN